VPTSDPLSNVNQEFPNSTGSEVTTPLDVTRSSRGHNDIVSANIGQFILLSALHRLLLFSSRPMVGIYILVETIKNDGYVLIRLCCIITNYHDHIMRNNYFLVWFISCIPNKT